MITEIGGTVGDIESQPFMEAIRQVAFDVGRENVCYIHVTLVPYITGSGEFKSKPTQHSVKELQSLGIAPNIIVTRVDQPLDEDIRDKIALFCNVKKECVIENLTLPVLYQCPMMLEESHMSDIVLKELGIDAPAADMTEWNQMLQRIANRDKTVTIALVGKYVKLHDAYLSVVESLNHAGYENAAKVEIKWVDSEDVTEETAPEIFGDVQGILVPGGFGHRGVEGKIIAARYARTHNVPYLGICLGMQVAVIEFGRHVLGLTGAHSAEFDPATPYPVIDLMPDQKGNLPKGGTMRLGAYPCKISEDSIMSRAYGQKEVNERHRHRYEFNNAFRDSYRQGGMRFTGTSPDGHLVEAVEIPEHKFYIGVQYHPEFKSRPNRAHPLFREFVKAALGD